MVILAWYRFSEIECTEHASNAVHFTSAPYNYSAIHG